MRFSYLSFMAQCIQLVKATGTVSNEQIKTQEQWLGRIFLGFQPHVDDFSFLSLMCDLDDYYKLHHSLGGDCQVGFGDIMLFSFLRRMKHIEDTKYLIYLTVKTEVKLLNLCRIL